MRVPNQSSSWKPVPVVCKQTCPALGRCSHIKQRIWLVQIITENLAGLLLVINKKTPLDFHSLIQVFLWKLVNLFLPPLIKKWVWVRHGLSATQESLRVLSRLTRHSAPTFFAVTLLLKAFGRVKHGKLLVQASGHSQICQTWWLTLGNAAVCILGK